MTKDLPPEDVGQTAEEIAEAITRIDKAVQELSVSRLHYHTIVTLLQYSTKLPRRTIEYVLNALATLKANYLKKDTK